MYDINQFIPTLYLLLLMGFTGFALAAQSAGIWVFSVLFLLGNAWLIKNRLFKPMPRFVANLIAMLSLAFVMIEVQGRSGSPIIVIGEALVLLQLIKIWEQRGNRDYAQLLVLSLLLMVAAAISTASLVFGVLFIIYLFVSLYCCLLFHLKVETDEVRAAMFPPAEQIPPGTLRHDEHFLPSSMRRVTGLIASFSIACAVMVFLLFPRSGTSGVFGQMQWRQRDTLTGFSEDVSFQQVAKISQNEEPVAEVQIWKAGQLQDFDSPLYLRGVTHDVYNGVDPSGHNTYGWSRTAASSYDERVPVDMQSEWRPRDAQHSGEIRQEIHLRPTGTRVLFTVAGPVAVTLKNGNIRQLELRYSAADESIQASDPLIQPLEYEVYSSGELGNESPNPNRSRSQIDPQIRAYARRPEVTGGLADRRLALANAQPKGAPYQPTPLDEPIAKAIESHLRNSFSYTLDLTDAARTQGRDPVVAFLYDFKRGHCEYFAGAMTLLCQSLGMEARMVVGFKCDKYNDFGHYYDVRQSHAHAWVEVLLPGGWKTFDPTSGHESGPSQASAWDKTKSFFGFLEYKWANTVIAYDSDNRENVIQNIDNQLATAANSGSSALGNLKVTFDAFANWLAERLIGPVMILLGLSMLIAVGWFMLDRWRLRQRASRIGIRSLPASTQIRLVRQLGFYDDLLLLLERHHIHRPRHLTPKEFSDSLSYLPSEAYDIVRRLTNLFYRIRYGEGDLNHGQQRRLGAVLGRLSEALPRVKRSHALAPHDSLIAGQRRGFEVLPPQTQSPYNRRT